MLAEAKRIMNDKALSSDLPAIANRQINVMIQQLAATMSWELEMPNSNRIAPVVLPKVLPLAEKAEFEELPPV